jgi:hypothetical protein
MSNTGGRKRLEPKMTRGSFRFMLGAWAIQVVISGLLAFNALAGPGDEWNRPAFFLAAALFVLNLGFLAYLLRVRRHDSPFWDEEEARREDWDRRGRRLYP